VHYAWCVTRKARSGVCGYWWLLEYEILLILIGWDAPEKGGQSDLTKTAREAPCGARIKDGSDHMNSARAHNACSYVQSSL